MGGTVADVANVATWLQATGPYGLVVILGWAFWRIHERKDQALRELYERVAQLGTAQTEAMTKMDASLDALTAAIERMAERSYTKPGPRASSPDFPRPPWHE
jgi:hypothetical protein